MQPSFNGPALAGPCAPVLTPFTREGQLDMAAFRNHLAFLARAGLKGILVLGTNGEFGQLSTREKLRLLEAALDAVPGMRILVGATIPSDPGQTIELASQLRSYKGTIGGLLVAPPFYDWYERGSPVTGNAVIRFYLELFEAITDMPVMLYNVAQHSGIAVTAPITPAVISALESVRNLIGIKDSSGRLENIQAFKAVRQDLQIMVGTDRIIVPALKLGAVGSITACANPFPTALLSLYNASTDKGRQGAQADLTALRDILESIPGKMIAVQKLLLHHLGVTAMVSPVRQRERELSNSEQGEILQRLAEIPGKLNRNPQIQSQIKEIFTRR